MSCKATSSNCSLENVKKSSSMNIAENSNPNSEELKEGPLRLPPWLKIRLPKSPVYSNTLNMLQDLNLNTVCQGARCPNQFECFASGTATFMILGANCTRNCAFCNIGEGKAENVDADEPGRVAEAALRLKLEHVVVTSVTRDDLPDGGAAHFSATVRAIRQKSPASRIELLIPDFQGNASALECVIQERPDIINHNLETHPAHYHRIRPQAQYARSLELLQRVKAAGITSKSGFMAGLGESDEEIFEVLRDLSAINCDIVTIGQYLSPSRKHLPASRYVTPETFEHYADYARKLGIAQIFSAPLARSSYHAGTLYKQ